MKIALIGATGFVGSRILEELLTREQDHEVIAIARNVEKIDVKNPKVKAVSVDVSDTAKLAEALKGCKVVINAFNAGWDNPNLYDDNMKGNASIQSAVRAANIRRYFVVGNAGSLYEGSKQLVDTDDFPKEMKEGAKASRDYAQILRRETYLDWVHLAPQVGMNESVKTGRTGRFRTGSEEPLVKDGTATISAEDYAVAVANEVEKKAYSRKSYTVGY